MHVITKSRLRDFWKKHPDSETPLRAWFRVASKTRWSNISDVRKTYPQADKVGELTVFNIGGGKYRLIGEIVYRFGKVYVRNILTHSEYDRERWKT